MKNPARKSKRPDTKSNTSATRLERSNSYFERERENAPFSYPRSMKRKFHLSMTGTMMKTSMLTLVHMKNGNHRP